MIVIKTKVQNKINLRSLRIPRSDCETRQQLCSRAEVFLNAMVQQGSAVHRTNKCTAVRSCCLAPRSALCPGALLGAGETALDSWLLPELVQCRALPGEGTGEEGAPCVPLGWSLQCSRAGDTSVLTSEVQWHHRWVAFR
jgi:hypothetical protein